MKTILKPSFKKAKSRQMKGRIIRFKDFNGVLRSETVDISKAETIRARREHDRVKIKEFERNN